MAAGIVTKVVGDGNGGTVSIRYWCPDTSASPQLLFPAPLMVDEAGDVVAWDEPVPITGVDGATIATVANPFPTKTASTALTDGSTTITAGGTAQNAFAAAAVVNGYEIVNPDPSEDLWISDTTTAVANGTGCIRVAANGGAYSSPPGMAPSAAVSVVAATTGHKFTARRW